MTAEPTRDFKLTSEQIDDLLETFDRTDRKIQREIVAELAMRNVKLQHELAVANLALELTDAARKLKVCRCGGVIMPSNQREFPHAYDDGTVGTE